ncbi:MAG: hypothetical protein D8M57_14225 [Candidatus Scalindua sp. AMX11]|nr:MAG: hypothetical protein DWQ00_09500 [Candidatus Scalindua sp.]RZV70943.1 MAG: hypothetical protein EX341_15175 [Candidatus Scalindua sp. SCAELEC01]TDE64250.1 MAG: hypothetical protein D8M57_14225 [Candidatus Scalindua sp. AMX11]GJQ59957.1 MAG: hypothetical protein SCALA701_27580 [Candidatus Scalindua sp.]
MNKTLLIVVCDFLIISILSLGNFSDYLSGKSQEGGGNVLVPVQADILDSLATTIEIEKQIKENLQASKAKTEEELQKEIDTKKQHEKELEELQKERAQLNRLLNVEKGESSKIVSHLNKLEVELSEKKRLNVLLEGQIAQVQEKSEYLKTNLKEKSKKLELTQTNLHTALNSIESLSSEVAESKEHARSLENRVTEQMETLSQSKVAYSTLQEQLKARTRKMDELVYQTRKLEQQRRNMEKEINEKNEALAKAREESLIQELEKNKELAEREKSMAVQENQIETLELRLLNYSNNELFQRFLDRRCEITLEANGKGLISSVSYRNKIDAVLVKSPDQTGILLHYKDSPLDWSHFEKDLESLSVGLLLKGQGFTTPLYSFSALEVDPRILFLKLTNPLPIANILFEIETEISRFDEALLIRGNDGKYASFKLQLIPGRPNYFQVPSSLKTRLFGSFSPKPGDLVFSRNGKLLGIMASTTEALRLSNLTTVETFQTGGTRDQRDQAIRQATYQNWENRLDSGHYSLPDGDN